MHSTTAIHHTLFVFNKYDRKQINNSIRSNALELVISSVVYRIRFCVCVRVLCVFVYRVRLSRHLFTFTYQNTNLFIVCTWLGSSSLGVALLFTLFITSNSNSNCQIQHTMYVKNTEVFTVLAILMANVCLCSAGTVSDSWITVARESRTIFKSCPMDVNINLYFLFLLVTLQYLLRYITIFAMYNHRIRLIYG